MAFWKPARGPSPYTRPASTLILDFTPPELWEINVWCLQGTQSIVSLFQQLTLMKTPGRDASASGNKDRWLVQGLTGWGSGSSGGAKWRHQGGNCVSRSEVCIAEAGVSLSALRRWGVLGKSEEQEGPAHSGQRSGKETSRPQMEKEAYLAESKEGLHSDRKRKPGGLGKYGFT